MYEQPRVEDYGTIATMTRAMSLVGSEDGGSKIDTAVHNDGVVVQLPSIPLVP